MNKPRICILRTDGTNCDEETAYAFRKAGGESVLVHVNELRAGRSRLSDCQVLAVPGGFSYGDDIRSGRILANELVSFLGGELQEFVGRGGLVIGICNGFQVLACAGLLPFASLGVQRVTLAQNASGRFECRPLQLLVEHSPCVFTKGLDDEVHFQGAHAEGRFRAEESVLEEMERNKLVVFRYALGGSPTMAYPDNPNGAIRCIAGVCDPTGRLFALMPHPERFVEATQYPNWRRERLAGRTLVPHGLKIFENAVKAASEI